MLTYGHGITIHETNLLEEASLCEAQNVPLYGLLEWHKTCIKVMISDFIHSHILICLAGLACRIVMT